MIASSVLLVFSSVLAGIGLDGTSFALEGGVQQSNPKLGVNQASPWLVAQTRSPGPRSAAPRQGRRLEGQRLPSQNNSSSSSNSGSTRRSYRGLIRLGIFAIILLFGLGGWIVKKSGGN